MKGFKSKPKYFEGNSPTKNQCREREREREYGENEVRGSEEAFGAPERIVEVGAVALELRSKAAVYHGGAAGFAEKVGHQRTRSGAAQLHRRHTDRQKSRDWFVLVWFGVVLCDCDMAALFI